MRIGGDKEDKEEQTGSTDAASSRKPLSEIWFVVNVLITELLNVNGQVYIQEVHALWLSLLSSQILILIFNFHFPTSKFKIVFKYTQTPKI